MQHKVSVLMKENCKMDCRCDRCGKVFPREIEARQDQTLQRISVVGGSASVFGAGKRVEAIICQSCMLTLIKDFCRVAEPEALVEGGTPIGLLGVSRYTLDRLVESGVVTIEQLCRMEETEVKKAAGGSSSFREVLDALQAKSFKRAA